jgi:hypothetical protein
MRDLEVRSSLYGIQGILYTSPQPRLGEILSGNVTVRDGTTGSDKSN